MQDDLYFTFRWVFTPCIILIFQLPPNHIYHFTSSPDANTDTDSTTNEDDDHTWWLDDNREDRVYRQGHFLLFDNKNKECIWFGEYGKNNKLRNGEICVKTITPTTKRGYYDSSSDNVVVRLYEQIPLAENILMDHSYIGNRS